MSASATWSRRWHAALAAVVAASLAGQVGLTLTADDTGGAARGLLQMVSFFTVQSNLLVLVAAVSLARDPSRDGAVWRVLRLSGLLGITVTGLVFGTVLAPLVQHEGIGWWTNAGFHYVAPTMALLGWLAFGPRPRVDGRTLAWTFAWPIAWIVYTFVRGAVVDWYPYPFLDASELGLGVALRNTGVVVVLAVLLLALFRWADRRFTPRG
ncbi:Pr6Pr family membrane protein [Kineococcus sp. SYSU DK003]|uniref:Pr6Pr family membrane protein n=1 Tax=Kineococcus sp. SYSU DK003 TaxID=3383124 RepID=UPI003D7ECA84